MVGLSCLEPQWARIEAGGAKYQATSFKSPWKAGELRTYLWITLDSRGESGIPQNFFNSEVDYMFECPAVDPSSQLVLFAGVGATAHPAAKAGVRTRVGAVVKAAGVC